MCSLLLPHEINKTDQNEGYLGDVKLKKQVDLIFLFIFSYPHKANTKN